MLLIVITDLPITFMFKQRKRSKSVIKLFWGITLVSFHVDSINTMLTFHHLLWRRSESASSVKQKRIKKAHLDCGEVRLQTVRVCSAADSIRVETQLCKPGQSESRASTSSMMTRRHAISVLPRGRAARVPSGMACLRGMPMAMHHPHRGQLLAPPLQHPLILVFPGGVARLHLHGKH